MTKTKDVRRAVGLILASVTTVVLGARCGDTGAGGGDDISDKEALALCEEMSETWCRKLFECSPEIASMWFEATDASGCADEAKRECRLEDDTSEDDGCIPEQTPTKQQYQDCIDAVDGADCGHLEALYETGPCAVIDEMLDCEEDSGDTESSGADGDTDADGDADGDADTDGDADGDADTDGDGDADGDTDGDTDSDADGDSDTGKPPTEIHTEGCVTAVESLCDIAAGCAEGLDTIPSRLSEGIDSCPDTVTENESTIEEACQEYLTQEVPTGTPVAVFLNDTSPSTVEACMTGDNCSLADLSALIEALAVFVGSPSSSDLAALLTPYVDADCL